MRESRSLDLAEVRPSLVGFDQYAAGLMMLTNQIISLRMENGNAKLKHLKGPVFPTEIVEERMRAYAATKRMSAIEASQARSRARREAREAQEAASA